MEQLPTGQGGAGHDTAAEGTEPRLAARIQAALEVAEAEQRTIDDGTAREVAQALDGEATSAIGALAGCGVVLEDDVYQELYADLDSQTLEKARMVDALRDYCLGRANKGPVSYWRSPEDRDTASGLMPQVWIGSLAAYNSGVLHGAWVDAYQDEEDLRTMIAGMLRTSPIPDDEEYAIFDDDDFCGVQVGEYESLGTISRLANGIAEHGEPFAVWAGCLGLSRLDDAERTFEDAFRGHWESMKAYVEDYLDEGDVYRFKEFIPEWLRDYVTIDVEQLAQDWESDYYVVEARNGGVWVFETRT